MDFDWNHARTLLAVLETGSLTAAAEALGSSQPTVGRHVAALESQLGAVLFTRAGGALLPTPLARELEAELRRMEQAAARVSFTAAGRAQELRGSVRISASEAICGFLLPGVLGRLRAEHPELELELVADNQLSDLSRGAAEIAVRNVPPQDPELISRKVGSLQAWLYGSVGWLTRNGRPRRIEDLAGADFIAFEPKAVYLQGLQAAGFPVALENLRLSSASQWSHLGLARAGAGLALLMEPVGEGEPTLRRILPGVAPGFPVPLHLTARRELRTAARVRVVFDALAQELATWCG